MCRNLSIGWLALLLCSPALPAAAQPSGNVAEKIDVNIVNVDLYVSDRKGNPVTGLAAKDFQLFEDEKKVKISNFSRVEDGSDQRASLIIYVDDTHVSAGSRDNVLDALLPFIEGRMASEGAAVMVVHFGQILEVEQDFTRDPDAVRSAFDAIKLVEPVGEKNLAIERSFRADAKQTMELLQGGTQNARLGRAALDGVLASALGYAESSRTQTDRKSVV